jgi:hypothetical protein
MDMWQRSVSLKMSWDFSVLGRVTSYREGWCIPDLVKETDVKRSSA